MDQIRIMALGGLDENGKNMFVIEVNDSIFIIEAGLRYPESEQLGVEYIIPDFSYLVRNKEKVKGIFITHGHDDVMGALPYLLKQINAPVYTGSFTAKIIKDILKRENIKNAKIITVKKSQNIDGIKIKTFAMTHSMPNNFGIAIKTDQGYIVYTGEFIVDYDIRTPQFACDLNELSDFGSSGVLCLLNESHFADRAGHTAPQHRIGSLIEPTIITATGRIIISCYEQSLFRIIEILNIAIKYNKKVYFHDKTIKKLLTYLDEMKYYSFPKDMVINEKDFNNDLDDSIVLVTGAGKNLFRKMQKIALKEDNTVTLRKNDSIIVASPMVSGTELEATNMENEIYKEGGKIFSLSSKTVLSMHPSCEDLKMMMYLFKPKYYIPVKGEYRHLIANAEIATNMGYLPDKIIIMDNGQQAIFENKSLKTLKSDLEINDTMIDGKENWDVTGVVLKDRETLSTDGVMIVGVSLDFQTKKIVGGPDVQTRGLIYLKDAEHIVKEVGNIIENCIVDALANHVYDNKEVRNTAREKITKYLMKETGKRPMVLPVIIEIQLPDEFK